MYHIKLGQNDRKLFSTLMNNLSTFKVDRRAGESMRGHQTFRPVWPGLNFII